MADAILEVQLGNVRFSAQGTESWVNTRYESFFTRLDSEPTKTMSSQLRSDIGASEDQRSDIPLAIFLKNKKVGVSQNLRFLATAVWLVDSGKATIKTADVVHALEAAQQKRLGNPADVLNKNVGKGYCVKVADGFYVTPEGRDALDQPHV